MSKTGWLGCGLLVFFLSGFWLQPAHGAGISSTTSQLGTDKYISGGSGRILRLGTFTYAPPLGGYAPFTALRLRSWMNFSGAGTAPKLLLGVYDPANPSPLPIVGLVPTGLAISNSAVDSSAVAEQQSDWHALPLTEGTALSNFVNANPTFNAWLFSPDIPDFNTPAASTIFDPATFSFINIPYTTTLEFLAIPEPNSCMVWTLVIGACCWRRNRRVRQIIY